MKALIQKDVKHRTEFFFGEDNQKSSVFLFRDFLNKKNSVDLNYSKHVDESYLSDDEALSNYNNSDDEYEDFRENNELYFIFNCLDKKYANIASKTKIVRRCSLTGRSRSSQRVAGVSRMIFKQMISSKTLPGFYKLSW